MAREIAGDDLAVEAVGSLRRKRVRPRADERELAFDHVQELRQLIEAGLAKEAADTGHAIIGPGHEQVGVGVAAVGVHRAELADLDQLIVEAVALLAEEDGPAAS